MGCSSLGRVALMLPSDQCRPVRGRMVFGFLIGVFGHIIRSRALILTGIVMVGAVSAYFAFVVAKVT